MKSDDIFDFYVKNSIYSNISLIFPYNVAFSTFLTIYMENISLISKYFFKPKKNNRENLLR